MPSVSKTDAKDYDKDDWKLFFIWVKKFLKKEIEKVVIPTSVDTWSKKEEEIRVEDIPF